MASLAVTTSKSPEQKKPAYMQVQTLREEKVELVGQVRNLRDEVTGLSASLAMGEAQRTELNSQRLELTQQLGASRAEQPPRQPLKPARRRRVPPGPHQPGGVFMRAGAGAVQGPPSDASVPPQPDADVKVLAMEVP